MEAKTFTHPKTLAERTTELADNALLDGGDGGLVVILSPIAEQHFILATLALAQAKAQFELASYHLTRRD